MIEVASKVRYALLIWGGYFLVLCFAIAAGWCYFGIGDDAIFTAAFTMLATFPGIIIAFYALCIVYNQLKQASSEFGSISSRTFLETLNNLMIAASNNIHSQNVDEGMLVAGTLDRRHVLAWRMVSTGESGTDHCQFNVFLRVLSEHEIIEDADMKDEAFWDYRFIIPRQNNNHGVMVQVPEDARGNREISSMDAKYRGCTLLALRNVQLLDINKLRNCRKEIQSSPLKEINENITKQDIFEYSTTSVAHTEV